MIKLQTNEIEEKDWPNQFWRILLWPIADFRWRKKVLDRQLYQSLNNAIAIEMPPNGIVHIFGNSLAPCSLLADGIVRVGDEQFGPNANFRKKLDDQDVEFVREDHVLKMVTNHRQLKGNGRMQNVPTDWFYAYENGIWWRWKSSEPTIVNTLIQEFNLNRERGERFLAKGFVSAFVVIVVVWVGMAFYTWLQLWNDDI